MSNSHSFIITPTIKIGYSKWFLIVLFLYIIVAYKSSGYHQEDEHYQLIEFANYKLGLVPENRLAWEFKEQIRPGFQPMICYFFLKGFHLVGIHDGYTITFLLRAISGLFSIFVISRFVRVYGSYIDSPLQPYFFLLSYLLWFLPYINVRFSSETWSGLFFLLTLTIIEHNKNSQALKKYLFIGILLGISILFRYQSALIALGIILWLFLVHKSKIRDVLTTAFIILTVLCLGMIFDYWLYGEITCTVYNYFNVNLIKGVSASFGVSPFYEYIYYVITAPGPFGIFILLAFLIVSFYNPKNVIIWAIIPFILIHSLIPHKELRFLFPIANVVPFLIFYAFLIIKNKLRASTLLINNKPVTILILTLFSIINCTGLIGIASTGAGTKRTAVTEWIHRKYGTDKLNIIIINVQNPYMDWGPPKNTYYSSSQVNLEYVNSIWQEDFLTHKKKGYKNLLVISDEDITGERAIQRLKTFHLVKVYQNIPDFLTIVYRFYDPDMNDLRLNVYEFE